MYNLLPLYQQRITGAGVTIAIAAQSDGWLALGLLALLAAKTPAPRWRKLPRITRVVRPAQSSEP
jgi:hypothetical protein